MERLTLKYKDASKALGTFAEILREPFSKIIRDAAIQRFEYTFEALWKFLKQYLYDIHGIACNSPKSCFKEIFSQGYLSEEETSAFLEMTDRRNETSHTYKEEVSNIIYKSSPNYCALMQRLLERFRSFQEK